MIVLNEKETDLVVMAIIEGLLTTEKNLNMDFGFEKSMLTVHQQHRMQQIENLLYTLFCDVIEENDCVLQTKYDR